MAITPVTIIRKEREPDALDRIAQGLQIAHSVLGLGFSVPKFLQEKRESKARLDLADSRDKRDEQALGIQRDTAMVNASRNLQPDEQGTIELPNIAPGKKFSPRPEKTGLFEKLFLSNLFGNSEPAKEGEPGARPIVIDGQTAGYIKPKQKKEESSKGLEIVDKEFAKEYNDFALTGKYAQAEEDLKSLKPVLNDLQEGKKNLTGPLIGATPGLLLKTVNPAAADAFNRVRNVLQRNLRPILGAQFTAEEGERVIRTTYDTSLPENVVAARVESLINVMNRTLAEKRRAAKFFEDHSYSLKGYKPGYLPPSNTDALLDTIEAAGGVASASAAENF